MVATAGQSSAARASWREALIRNMVSLWQCAISLENFWQKILLAGLAISSHQSAASDVRPGGWDWQIVVEMLGLAGSRY